MIAFNKKRKPKHFTKPRWFIKNLTVICTKQKYKKYGNHLKGYTIVKNNETKKDKKFKQNIFKIENLGINKKFMFNGERYKVIQGSNCNECDFKIPNCTKMQLECLVPQCSDFLRKDEKNVIFKKTKENKNERISI